MYCYLDTTFSSHQNAGHWQFGVVQKHAWVQLRSYFLRGASAVHEGICKTQASSKSISHEQFMYVPDPLVIMASHGKFREHELFECRQRARRCGHV